MRVISSPHTLPKAAMASLSVKLTPAGSKGAMSSGKALIELLEHSLLCVCPADGMSLQGEIMLETRDQPIAVEAELEQTFVKVEQVAVLVPLKQCPQLGAENFLRLERDNLRFRLMPAAVDLERIGLQAVEVLVFARVDLDLELERLPPSASGVNLNTRCMEWAACARIRISPAMKGRGVSPNRLPDRFSLCLNEIDVF